MVSAVFWAAKTQREALILAISHFIRDQTNAKLLLILRCLPRVNPWIPAVVLSKSDRDSGDFLTFLLSVRTQLGQHNTASGGQPFSPTTGPPPAGRELNFEYVEREVKLGFISSQAHPHLPLRILNYTQSTPFQWRWNTGTLT